MALKLYGWDFIVKALEFLDSQMGVQYVSISLPLLWKIVRESMFCGSAGQKLLISRLLQRDVPSSVHQDFVFGAIDDCMAIANRTRKSVDGMVTGADHTAFRHTFDTLGLFVNEYAKSSHAKMEEDVASPPSEDMGIELDKVLMTCRCNLNPGPKEVSCL